MARISIGRLAPSVVALTLLGVAPGHTADAQWIVSSPAAPVIPVGDWDDLEDYYDELQERHEEYLDDLKDAYKARRKFYRRYGYRPAYPPPAYVYPRAYVDPLPPAYVAPPVIYGPSYAPLPYPAYGYPYGGGIDIGGPFGGVHIRW